ncbi:MAG: hypothetical protein U0271_33975 [Polyangiaceae bacterium]
MSQERPGENSEQERRARLVTELGRCTDYEQLEALLYSKAGIRLGEYVAKDGLQKVIPQLVMSFEANGRLPDLEAVIEPRVEGDLGGGHGSSPITVKIAVAVGAFAVLCLVAVLALRRPPTISAATIEEARPSLTLPKPNKPAATVTVRNCSSAPIKEGDITLASGAQMDLTGSMKLVGMSAESPTGVYVVWGLRIVFEKTQSTLQSSPTLSRAASFEADTSDIASAHLAAEATGGCVPPRSLELKVPGGAVTILERPERRTIVSCKGPRTTLEQLNNRVRGTLVQSGPTNASVWFAVEKNDAVGYGPFDSICYRLVGDPTTCQTAQAILGQIPSGMGPRGPARCP